MVVTASYLLPLPRLIEVCGQHHESARGSTLRRRCALNPAVEILKRLLGGRATEGLLVFGWHEGGGWGGCRQNETRRTVPMHARKRDESEEPPKKKTTTKKKETFNNGIG